MIVDPITLSPTHRIHEALELMKKYRISGVPITDDGSKEGRLVGILTNRDMRFATDPNTRVYELMTREGLITVPSKVDRDEAKLLLHRHRIEKLLVVDENYRCVGLITVKDMDKAQAHPLAARARSPAPRARRRTPAPPRSAPPRIARRGSRGGRYRAPWWGTFLEEPR